ncbi:MAG: Glucose-regulated metallo-peptidase [Chloroflexota bacterium]
MNIHSYLDIAHLDAQKFLETTDPGATLVLHPQRSMNVASVRAALQEIHLRVGTHVRVQTAMALYVHSKELTALQHYFPVIGWLDPTLRQRWASLYAHYLVTTPLTIVYIGNRREPAPLAIRAMVVGHLVSCFISTPHVLAALYETNPTFHICADARAYARIGGVGGGCYDERTHCIMLEVSRLFEGYWQPIPGVCPFLHELGHMLDGTHSRLSGGRRSIGDPPLLNDGQRAAWRTGKQTEVHRYRAYQHAGKIVEHAPLGHPYVFQTDGEFLAGYWEMFWRNPHAFGAHSPQLYDALMSYVGHDPRMYTVDYPGYVNGNRTFYGAGERAWPSQIRDEPTQL